MHGLRTMRIGAGISRVIAPTTAHWSSLGRLPAEQGAMLRLALERAMDWLYREAAAQVREAPTAADRRHRRARRWRADEHPFRGVPYAARQADALSALAERFLSSPPTADEGQNSADRFQVVVHVSAEALIEHGLMDPADAPQLEDGPVMAAESARRISCDAAIVRLIETGDGQPLDVGRKSRVIPPALGRAVKRRDKHCTWPGCVNARHTENHHCVHWADGGKTSLDNVTLTCRYHHRLLHEGGYFVVKDGDDFLFCRPDGSLIPPRDDSLAKSIARAQRKLKSNLNGMMGWLAEPRAVYRVSRKMRTADPPSVGVC